MQEYKFMKVTDVGATRWLEFNRPPVNAFNRQMVEEVRSSIASALEDTDVRVLVIGSCVDLYFSAGADLKEFQDMGSEGMADWVDLCHEIAELMRNSPKPLLAAIHGTAVGGGLELTLHCDVRFASSTAQLGQPEIQIGFIPPIATTQALARLIGRTRTLRYLYSGQMLSAVEALEWGLVDHLTAPGQLRSRVQAYAGDLVGKSASALAAIRQSVTLGAGMPFREGMALERKLAVSLADTPDFKEGVDAFLSKRRPKWAGS
ncbi:MAG: enoyl-CoA hydratase/isomerase family protein [Rhizobiales bacterium]|nr:enoyl-CoA hydratase/isomerase family protein [Hyphomicrobiales bacterium]